jgi:antitoxin MazE
MKRTELKVTQIGNSKGIRIPSRILKKYGFKDRLILEERPGEIVLRRTADRKLSWKDTFEEMAREKEDWSDFEGVVADGLEEA